MSHSLYFTFKNAKGDEMTVAVTMPSKDELVSMAMFAETVLHVYTGQVRKTGPRKGQSVPVVKYAIDELPESKGGPV